MASERDIQRLILLETCDQVRWERNNIGVAKIQARHVAYGVGGPGGSDLIGILRGRGTFVACEVKTPEWKPTNARDRKRWALQQQFLAGVREDGGIGFVGRSVDGVRAAIPLVLRRLTGPNRASGHLATMRGTETLCGRKTKGMIAEKSKINPCRQCLAAERRIRAERGG